eukprot:Nk52_evm20s242 gene=Nk52_evmTU20s242
MGDQMLLVDDPYFEGTLSKWTNYISGWQDRWVVLSGNVLSYYKSQHDVTYGCRGSINLKESRLVTYDEGDFRFDIEMNESVFYLRAESEELHREWITCIRKAKEALLAAGPSTDSLGVPQDSHRRTSSTSSVMSGIMSTGGGSGGGGSGTSSSTMGRVKTLREKLAELDTFREILVRQTGVLQQGFDSGSGGGGAAEDLREECLTFKATSVSMMECLEDCIELLQKGEDDWMRILEKEKGKRRALEEAFTSFRNRTHSVSKFGDPDMEEGPHNKLNEGEFFDAVEYALDEIDKIEEIETKNMSLPHIAPLAELEPEKRHRFSDEIDRRIKNMIHFSKEDLGSLWENVYTDSTGMNVYRKEVEENGTLNDFLKAFHVVPSISAFEMAQYFFDVKFRKEWEDILETCTVLERLDENTLIVQQVYRKVFPAAQRQAILCSHIRPLPDGGYIVCNFSTEHPDVKQSNRVNVTVDCGMVVSTSFVSGPANKDCVDRTKVQTKMIYMGHVSPGGWLPASVVRETSKRQYPAMIKKVSKGAIAKFGDGKEIAFGKEILK